jgi:hypothetical protein
MIALDVFYVGMSTIGIMILLQLATFVVTRLMYPPEPKIIYRDVPVQMASPPPQPPPQIIPSMAIPSLPQVQPAFTQQVQEIQLPEYEPRKPNSDSIRVDPVLPDGIQETRPPGT